jgi:polar amino acid transport system substrate-binding protein
MKNNRGEEKIMLVKFLRGFILFLITAAMMLGAAASYATETSQAGQPLRVGITPDFPPLVFRQGDKIVGIEVDFAEMLGKELNRPVKFIELKWDAQIPALLERTTDIIMSSMTATRERQVRIAFTEPYMKSGLVAGVRTGEALFYPTRENIMNYSGLIGVVPNTTSEAFVRKHFLFAQEHYIKYPRQAVAALEQRSIGMFICDAPTMIWIVSENESMEGIWLPLNDEYLAWGMRKDDQNLLARVNVALAQFRLDGRLDMVLRKWLPKQYIEKMK